MRSRDGTGSPRSGSGTGRDGCPSAASAGSALLAHRRDHIRPIADVFAKWLAAIEATATEISLELRSGHVVRLRGDVNEDQLVRVIRAAERAGC